MTETLRNRLSLVVVLAICTIAGAFFFDAGAVAAPRVQDDSGSLDDLAVGASIEIETKAGAKFSGSVISITERQIRVRTKFGTQVVNKDDIRSWSTKKSNAEIFEERKVDCKTPEDWCELAEWAASVGEGKLAASCYEEAIKLDPDHAAAREARGEVKVDGEWIDFEESMRRQGKELYGGDWLTPEEISARKAKEEAELKEQKLAGFKELNAQYEGIAWGDVQPILTENYEIWCDSTPEMANYYAGVMEAFFAEYSRIFPKKHFPRVNAQKGERSLVYIHRNHQQFMDWTGNGPNIGGFYQPWDRVVVAYHGSFGVTGSTDEVLAHEGTHQFQGIIFKSLSNAPVWIIEGMACYFGDGTEYNGRSVTMNVVPRDRLVGLKRAIRNGTYCDVKTLIRLPRGFFSGFHYGHAWGIIYWCLYGSKAKPKAFTDTKKGRDLMGNFLIDCASEDNLLDRAGYERMAKKFENMIREEFGKDIDTWEKEYKDWILSLELPPLGETKSGGRWVSEKLKIEVKKPSGWKWVNEENLHGVAMEVVASEKSGRGTQRISTHCAPNALRGEISPQVAKRFLEGAFVDIEYELEPTQKDVKSFPAVEAIFKAKRRVRQESGVQDANEKKEEESGGKPVERRFRVVCYADVDKIRANVLESDDGSWDSAQKDFEAYLENFKITYDD